MNIVMNLCILILSVFPCVAILGCGDPEEPAQSDITTSPPDGSSSQPDKGEKESLVDDPPVPDEILPPVDNPPVPDEILPPVDDPPVPDEILPPVDNPPVPDEIDKLDFAQQEAFNVFKKGNKVFVQNTGVHGLKIRVEPNGDQIGGMFDGETGTITDHPRIANKLLWFFIEWDRPVKDRRSGCGQIDICIGWSAAVTQNGLKVLGLP